MFIASRQILCVKGQSLPEEKVSNPVIEQVVLSRLLFYRDDPTL